MDFNLKCLLLDDEMPGLAYLKILCEQIRGIEVVKAFNKPEVFLAEVSNLKFDVCLLDIEMPGISGLQIAELMHGKPVVFITAYKQYGADAYDINAVDYLRKPVSMERLIQAFKKVTTLLGDKKSSARFFQWNTDEGKALVFFDQLLYVTTSEIDSRDKFALLADGSTTTLKNITFDKLEQLLPNDGFVRINKKDLVALKAIKVFSFDEVSTNIPSTEGGLLKLPLSEKYRHSLKRKLE